MYLNAINIKINITINVFYYINLIFPKMPILFIQSSICYFIFITQKKNT